MYRAKLIARFMHIDIDVCIHLLVLVPPVPEKLLLPVNMTEKGSTVTVTLPQLNEANGPIKSVP